VVRRALPSLLVVTDGQATGARSLVEVVAAAVAGGARAVLLREKHLARDQRIALAERLGAVLAPVDGILLVASDPTIPGGGVHLAAVDSFPGPPRPAGLVGRSCHSSADLVAAAGEGCDYATLSPIFLTASKPGYGPALGPAAIGDPALPTWALGGVDATNAQACVKAGAAGVAVMGAIMRASDPATVVSGVLDAIAPGRSER
jgi:thiamine-phosphate pyrophosphorylase